MKKIDQNKTASIRALGFNYNESKILNKLTADELALEIRKNKNSSSVASKFKVLILKVGNIQQAKDILVNGLSGTERKVMLNNLRIICYRLRKEEIVENTAREADANSDNALTIKIKVARMEKRNL